MSSELFIGIKLGCDLWKWLLSQALLHSPQLSEIRLAERQCREQLAEESMDLPVVTAQAHPWPDS